MGAGPQQNGKLLWRLRFGTGTALGGIHWGLAVDSECENDNKGRGVVLIGHSQGSSVLTQLIKNEIEGKPIQSKIISVWLLGTNVAVPKGKDVGGAFQHMPLCRSSSQPGCVISYVTFRSDVPPPANSRFGRVATEGMTAACVNPAALKESPTARS